MMRERNPIRLKDAHSPDLNRSFGWGWSFFHVLVGFLFFSLSATAGSAGQCSDLYSPKARFVETPHGKVQITSESAIALLRDQQTIKEALSLRGPEKIKALLAYSKQKTQSNLNVGLTFVNYAMAMFLAHDIAVKLAKNPESLAPAAALIPVTWVAADAVSSAYHYFLDNWASPRNKIWGSAATAFRRHHEVPNNLSQTGFVQNISAFGKLMAPLYVATAVASPGMSAEVQTQALVALLLFSHGTEIHRQAHLPQPNRFVRWFQDKRILLNSEAHNQHHRKPIDSDYGIINGSSNRLMNGFYERLDKILYRFMGRMPNHWIQHPRSIPDSVVNELLTEIHRMPQELIVTASLAKNSDERIDQVLKVWIDKFGHSSGEAKDAQN
ncbi:MAG: fatty acid desaturase family protein [Proteobacteria bacterium]|nr:fatty acid desaturase family protein [Pseudomonadota bacterium]